MISREPAPAIPDSKFPIPGSIRVALVAGEASGDQLGAGLIRGLRARFPGAEFAGIGGHRMRAEGLEAWYDSGELAVMGLAEVLRHLPRLLRLRRALVERAAAWRPHVFVGIDAPDFNLGVERRLKARGIRTAHYVSPSIWAWREKRAQKIGRSADRVLCLFPMEPPIYARHGVDARFVGHPLADRFPLDPDRGAARAALGVAADARALALLPGSRLGEIHRIAPAFLSAFALLRARLPDLRAIAPMADSGARAAFEAVLAAHPERERLSPALTIVDGRAHECMIAADAVLLASGTAALEAMLAKRPMVVAYRIAPLTHFLVKRLGLLKVDRYSLPNVLAGEALVPELMQDECTPSRLAAATLRWFEDDAAIAALLPKFRAIHASLRQNADARAAEAVAELIGGNSAKPPPG